MIMAYISWRVFFFFLFLLSVFQELFLCCGLHPKLPFQCFLPMYMLLRKGRQALTITMHFGGCEGGGCWFKGVIIALRGSCVCVVSDGGSNGCFFSPFLLLSGGGRVLMVVNNNIDCSKTREDPSKTTNRKCFSTRARVVWRF